MKKNLKRTVVLAAAAATLGLAGCMAVPVNDGYGGYAPAPAVYVAPPAVVVRPWFYSYYAGGHGGHHYH